MGKALILLSVFLGMLPFNFVVPTFLIVDLPSCLPSVNHIDNIIHLLLLYTYINRKIKEIEVAFKIFRIFKL